VERVRKLTWKVEEIAGMTG